MMEKEDVWIFNRLDSLCVKSLQMISAQLCEVSCWRQCFGSRTAGVAAWPLYHRWVFPVASRRKREEWRSQGLWTCTRYLDRHAVIDNLLSTFEVIQIAFDTFFSYLFWQRPEVQCVALSIGVGDCHFQGGSDVLIEITSRAVISAPAHRVMISEAPC